MANVNRKHYKELNIILWDMHCKYISESLAFSMYERRWAYIDKRKLTAKEKRLIASLTYRFGKGVFLAGK
ncbi:hypothetical protein LMH73_017855 [Vibrio splendidus]|nr:hypothetical protein [Vibrio splendidus]MCC4883091.1 hypothetical protein [Vibrio splendidus]